MSILSPRSTEELNKLIKEKEQEIIELYQELRLAREKEREQFALDLMKVGTKDV